MIILCLLLISILNFNVIPPVYAAESEPIYARVMAEDCYLYRTPMESDDYSNVFFKLPRTYFVLLSEDVGEKFYKVSYLNCEGYVKKNCVRAIIGTPKKPYYEAHFRVYSDQSRVLRSEPTSVSGSSSQIVYVPLYSRDLTFIGSVAGETFVDGRTNIWYYCKFSAEKDYYGYVYSEFCDEFELETIPQNKENVTYTDLPVFNKPSEEKTSIPVESKTTGVVIAILCVPALIFVFLVVKSSKFSTKERVSNKEVKDF